MTVAPTSAVLCAIAVVLVSSSAAAIRTIAPVAGVGTAGRARSSRPTER
jgi:hypothetical protein